MKNIYSPQFQVKSLFTEIYLELIWVYGYYTVPVAGNIAVVEVAIDTVAVVVAVMFAA